MTAVITLRTCSRTRHSRDVSDVRLIGARASVMFLGSSSAKGNLM